TKQAWPWKVILSMRPRTSSFSNELSVLLRIEQLIEVRGILDPELDHPTVAIGLAVHERRVAIERRVHFGDRARERREQLGHGLHRLDRAEGVHAPKARPNLGQLDRSEEHTSELQSRE